MDDKWIAEDEFSRYLQERYRLNRTIDSFNKLMLRPADGSDSYDRTLEEALADEASLAGQTEGYSSEKHLQYAEWFRELKEWREWIVSHNNDLRKINAKLKAMKDQLQDRKG